MLKLMDNKITDIQSLAKAQQQPDESEGQPAVLVPSSGPRLREWAGDVRSGSEGRGDGGGEKMVRVVESDSVAAALAALTSSIDRLSCNVAAVDHRVAAQGLQLEQHASQLQLLRCQSALDSQELKAQLANSCSSGGGGVDREAAAATDEAGCSLREAQTRGARSPSLRRQGQAEAQSRLMPVQERELEATALTFHHAHTQGKGAREVPASAATAWSEDASALPPLPAGVALSSSVSLAAGVSVTHGVFLESRGVGVGVGVGVGGRGRGCGCSDAVSVCCKRGSYRPSACSLLLAHRLPTPLVPTALPLQLTLVPCQAWRERSREKRSRQ